MCGSRSAAREQTARVVHSGPVMMDWHIGRRIRQDGLQNERARRYRDTDSGVLGEML